MTSNSNDRGVIAALCVCNSAVDLGTPTKNRFYSEGYVFDLQVGKEYPILGIGIFETVVLALVLDETRSPDWYPIGLFRLEAAEIPDDWLLTVFDGLAASGGDASNRWVAKAGYARLVEDPDHSDGLIEREEEHMRHFFAEYQRRVGGAVQPE